MRSADARPLNLMDVAQVLHTLAKSPRRLHSQKTASKIPFCGNGSLISAPCGSARDCSESESPIALVAIAGSRSSSERREKKGTGFSAPQPHSAAPASPQAL